MTEWNTGSQLAPPVNVYPDDGTGTPTDPTAAYTFSAPQDMAGFILGEYTITTSGDVPTSFEVKRQWADAADLTAALALADADWCDEDREGVSPGAFLAQKEVGTIADSTGSPANGVYRVRVERWSRRWSRLALKRTGGGAGTLVAATFTKAKE